MLEKATVGDFKVLLKPHAGMAISYSGITDGKYRQNNT